jgi:argininosuccinate lyase
MKGINPMKQTSSNESLGRGHVVQTSHFLYTYEHPLVPRIHAVMGHGDCFPWIDCAWAAMLIKQGIIAEKIAPTVAGEVLEFLRNPDPNHRYFAGLEAWMVERHGTEIGGSLTIGRTVPPLDQMARVRHELLILICAVHDVMDILLDTAARHADTILPGYTHLRHAQPTTFAHYLLSVFDPLQRSMREVENGFHLMSLNEMGCGALAGTSLPIDRELVTEYMGLDGLIENANDAVAYTDGYVTLTAALANFNAVFSRFALDLNIWSSEEYAFLDVPWTRMPSDAKGQVRKEKHTHSHFMPNKTNNCPTVERSRVAAAEVLGALTEVAAMGMRAPQADMHEMLHMADGTLRAIRTTMTYSLPYIDMLPHMTVFPERMLEAARSGWSAATELGCRLVMDHGLDYRTAHDILNEFIFASKQRGDDARSVRKQEFDAACQSVLGRVLDIDESELRRHLSPENFVRVTNSRGGVAPEEVRRMLAQRQQVMLEARKRQLARIERLEAARRRLENDLESWVAESR